MKLSNLPNTLIKLGCYHNKLTELSNLPNILHYFNCIELTKFKKLDKLLEVIFLYSVKKRCSK